MPLSELIRATGLSLPYVSQIRRGEKVPHPRHWPGFAAAMGALRHVGSRSNDDFSPVSGDTVRAAGAILPRLRWGWLT